MDKIDEAIQEITKFLIKQDVKDKKQNDKEIISMAKVDFYRFNIKLLKLLKKYL